MRLDNPDNNTRSGASSSSPPLHAEVRAAVAQLVFNVAFTAGNKGFKHQADSSVAYEKDVDAILQAVADALLSALPQEKNEICGICARIPIDFGGKEIPMEKRLGYRCRHAEDFNECLDAVTRVIGELGGRRNPDSNESASAN